MSGSTKHGPHDVIVAPVVSEKSYGLVDNNTYTFIVHPDANKTEIKEAVQAIWDVRVASVNTSTRKGKTKRFRMTTGRRADTKRAMVKLVAGDTIEIFEQQA